MKQKLIEAIREVSIADKTYEEYVTALAEHLNIVGQKKFKRIDALENKVCSLANRNEALTQVISEQSHCLVKLESVVEQVTKKLLEGER